MMTRNTARLKDLCSVLRSKNAGPFLITLDMIFKDRDAYDAVARDRLITRELIAQRYGLEPEDVAVVEYIDALCAVKATYKRRFAAGSPGDSDCFGMNQEAPLLDVEIQPPFLTDSRLRPRIGEKWERAPKGASEERHG